MSNRGYACSPTVKRGHCGPHPAGHRVTRLRLSLTRLEAERRSVGPRPEGMDTYRTGLNGL